MKQSAGLLPYRHSENGLEVFLVHPGGPWFAERDIQVWSLAKGEFLEDQESPFEAALREFEEETGYIPDPQAAYTFLGVRRQAGGKAVHAFAVKANFPEGPVESNLFKMEWPRGSGHIQSFPEVDKAQWFSLCIAEKKLTPGQDGFLHDLVRLLSLNQPPHCHPKAVKPGEQHASG